MLYEFYVAGKYEEIQPTESGQISTNAAIREIAQSHLQKGEEENSFSEDLFPLSMRSGSHQTTSVGFKDRIPRAQTIGTMESAAETRFFDGLELALSGSHNTAALYLLGYSTEISLKTAVYRLGGGTETSDVTNPANALTTFGYTWSGRNYHNLSGWLSALVASRAAHGLDILITSAAIYHAARVYAHWKETLRYSDAEANEIELREVYESANWIMNNYSSLWS